MPSFSIEAEGETNPLTAQDVFRVLSQISTASNQALRVSTKQLENWERTPGYYSILQDIYSDFTIDETIRLQAIIQLKNGIDKHWRKTSTQPIQKPEKARIRTKAIEIGVNEPTAALALQNALILAKIVRFEFPHDWSDVMSTLMGHLRESIAQVGPQSLDMTSPHLARSQLNSSTMYISNVVQITLQVVKELASGRLVRTKKSLEAVAPELLTILGDLYQRLADSWMFGARVQHMKPSHLTLKVLRRLMVMGFEHPHRDRQVKLLWDLLQHHYRACYKIWSEIVALGGAILEPTTGIISSHMVQFSKLWLEMARVHPASFVPLGCMDILNESWSILDGEDAKAMLKRPDWSVGSNGLAGDDKDSTLEKLVLRALLLFRACIKMVFNPVTTFKYQHPEDKEDRKAAIAQIKAKVFTDEFVVQLMEILITQYFILRPCDLRDWEEEPDEWERREEEIGDAWELSIRSCAEKLFLDLIINFKDPLVPTLLEVFMRYADVQNHEVLLKESLYAAIGVAAACLEDKLDFNGFIRNTLVPEVQLSLPSHHLLRRRTAILLGQWVPIKPDTLDRPAIYQIFAHLLDPADYLNDQVVRITAGRQLRLVLEPFEFDYKVFEPYALPIMGHLMSLIEETDPPETKMTLLETVRVAVTKLEGHIEPYAQGIMSALPGLWADSEDENLMKQAILTTITAIITSLGQKGTSYHASILPLIHDSVQPDSEAIVYLLEEALELWAAILAQTPSQNPLPELLQLATDLLPLLELGSEHLRQTFELVESYTVLSPATILHPSLLSPLVSSQKSMLPLLASSKSRDASLAPHVLENIVSTIALSTTFPPDQRQEALQHLTKTLLDTDYLSAVLEMLYEAYQYHVDPRPNKKPPDILGIGETSLFTLLSKLCLSNPNMFVDAISAAQFSPSPPLDTTRSQPTNTISWLIAHQLLTLDSCPETLRRKTQVLAITSLTSVPATQTLILKEHLQSYLTAWTSLLTELIDGAADESRGDYLFSPTPAVQDFPDTDTPEDVRKRRITNNDVCYTVNAREYITDKLRTLILASGGQAAFQTWLAQCDDVVVKAFAECQLPI